LLRYSDGDSQPFAGLGGFGGWLAVVLPEDSVARASCLQPFLLRKKQGAGKMAALTTLT
jgi:hypothetical protein